MMLDARSFGSLPPLRRLAVKLNQGSDFDAWLAAETQKVGDPAFASLFADAFPHFSQPPSAYAHRLVEADGLRLLGGIRFFGGNPERPFVEVVGWDRLNPPNHMPLPETVRSEWSAFQPRWLRLLTEPAAVPASARIDQWVHAARVGNLPPAVPALKVCLVPAGDPAEAAAFAADRYARVAADEPALGRDLSPMDAAAAADCRDRGTLDWIHAAGQRVGLLATVPGEVAFLRGHVVAEEVIAPEHGGCGFARAAQGVLAARLAQENPAALLLGTIDDRNARSRAAANAAGRPGILCFSFLELGSEEDELSMPA